VTHEFRLPDIGEGLTEADIIEWFVDVGDEITVDQTIVEIETAKTTVEITATHAGTMLALGGSPGDSIAVGDVLFVIGEESSPFTVHSSRSEDSSQQEESSQFTVHGSRSEDSSQFTVHSSQSDERSHSLQAGGGSVRAMPIVRKLAKERGIDLATVKGTGPGDAITRTDLETAPAEKATVELLPMGRRRKAISHHMAESWATIPHVTVQADIRAEQVLRARVLPDGRKLSLESIFGMAVIPLLERHREFNAVVRDDSIEYRHHCNLGIAIDTNEGLMVVVVRDADALSLAALDAEIARLAAAAQAGTLTPDEAMGQTFTISNIGALGGGHGTPIIPMGTSAILSIGRAQQAPVVEHGELAVGMVAPVDLSYDHRLIDGSIGQRFLSDLVTNLESIDTESDQTT
jgi:pyruvate/2-oxoglutarate dehydrogenase complex dihydrolipoamide acyltransferase (E2) component